MKKPGACISSLLGLILCFSLLQGTAHAQPAVQAEEQSNVFAAFNDWASRFQAGAASSARSSSDTSEGLALAKQRRTVLAQLVKTDPERALALALPESIRGGLPAEIRDEVETTISAVGDFTVLGALQRHGGPRVQPIHRKVRVDGQTYPAYVYGRRLGQTSQKGIALNGILVDGAVALEDPVVGKRDASGPPANPPSAWTTGLKNVLIIRVDFSDLPGDPIGNNDTSPISNNNTVYTQAYVQDVADNRISPFYFQSSYGLTTLSNTVSSQVYRMPQTAAAYATSATGSDQLHDDARAAATADFNMDNFERIVVLFSNLASIPGSIITYGGLGELVGKNIWLNGEFDFRVMTHELGHTYGLFHAGLWAVNDGNPISANGTIIEYGDDFDTMGANYANDSRTDFNPYYKNILGWLPDHKVQVADTNATYRIYAFDTANFLEATNNAIMAIKFVKDAQRTYWIGARRNFSDNSLMHNGAYVMWGFDSVGGGTGGGFQSGLLDLTTPGTSPSANLPNDYDAALDIKANFKDPSVNLSITPLEGDNSILNAYLDVQFGEGSSLSVLTNLINGGNGNGIIDFNECNSLYVVLTNSGLAASNITVTITTTTPKVIVAQGFSSYPDITNSGSGINLVPFQISTAPDFICGTPIDLALLIESDGETRTNFLRLPSGVTGLPLRFNNNLAVAIPDGDPAGVSSPIVVSNFNSVIGKVTVALHVTHPINFDLQMELIAPDGTSVMLSQNNGGGGQNYGAGCSDNLRTRFDDSALLPITGANAPFVGVFQPQQALSTFNLKSGTNVNGIWKLKVVDQRPFLTGAIQCWSLFLSPQSCTDGGGECPGSDLAVTMTDVPDPIVTTSNLTYTITVTNHGPSTAKAVVLNQVLPPSAVFLSATNLHGSVQHSGGTITYSFGQISARGSATATVTVIPTQEGTISSTATVASNEPDPDPSNNSVTVFTRVVPASADLAVTILDSTDPVSVGGSLTYTVVVTNRGPTTASNVQLTNVLPATAEFISASATSGSFINAGGTIIYNLGAIENGGGAVATIVVRPTEVGVITATARVTSEKADLFPGNNSASAATIVTPAADLALSIIDNPDPAVVGSNITYIVTLTNRGPNNVSNVSINGTLPASATFVSSDSPLLTTNGNTFLLNVGGTFSSGSSLTFNIVVQAPLFPQNLVMTAGVSASQADPDLSNNSVIVTTAVALAAPIFAADGSTLVWESIITNGTVDIGETVDVSLRLRNVGNIPTTNLIATLLSGNGVSSPSAPQSYGVLTNSSDSVGRVFRFTANGTNGQTITATLRLQDGSGPVTNVNFTFNLPSVHAFSNTNVITILNVGPADPYPSQINVSNVTGLVDKVTVTLNKINHTYSEDIDILLVDPTGKKVVLMSDVGGENPLSNVILSLDSSAVTALADSDQLASGTFRPANYEDTPVDFFTNAPAGPYETSLHTFNTSAPNGTWSLYVVDDTAGDHGNIAGGWSLAVTTIKPVNKIADLAMSVTASTSTALVSENISYTFKITNNGPDTASNVTLNNPLPPNAGISATFTNLGSLAPGSNATVVVTLSGTAAGSLTNTASVSASEIDLNLLNNSASAVTAIGLPISDVGIAVSAPATSTAGNNLVYTITVTNRGPDTAFGIVVTNRLPASAAYVSADTAVSVAGSVVTCALGNLAAGNSVSFSITATPLAAGNITNIANVVTTSSDQNGANNSVNSATLVSNPAPSIIASGAHLDAENLLANNSVDPGELVTMSLALANNGSANTANLVAKLLATGGVSPSSEQAYGALIKGGPAVSRPFTFTASGVIGGTVTATLELRDGTTNLGTVAFTFTLPRAGSFTNNNLISIPNSGPATPYPSTINVSGVTGLVSKVAVVLKGLTHSFPDDLDILLVGPGGQQLLLMSDAGGSHGLNLANLSFDDSGVALPDAIAITNGLYRPTDYELGGFLVPPAPGGPYANSFAVFNGSIPNGDWSLYVADDSGADFGSISGGWTLNLTTINPINNEFILSALLINGTCHLTLNGQSGSTYRIEASSNLADWSPISTNIAVNGVCDVIDHDAPNFNPRFYRAVLVP